MVGIAVLATAHVVHARLILLAVGAVAVFAGRGVAALARRSAVAAAGVLILALALAPGASASVTYVAHLTRPSTRDRALDWIEAHVPEGSRILMTRHGRPGVDPTRLEVAVVEHLHDSNFAVAAHADYVVAGPTDPRRLLRRLHLLFRAAPDHPEDGTRVEVLTPPPWLRPAYEPVPLDAARLTASENLGALERVRDGNPLTAWRTRGRSGGDSWIDVELTEPRDVGRTELVLGAQRAWPGRGLRVWTWAADGRLAVVEPLEGRPAPEAQLGDALASSQVLIFDPRPAARIRVVQAADHDAAWAVAELRVDAVVRGAPGGSTEPGQP